MGLFDAFTGTKQRRQETLLGAALGGPFGALVPGAVGTFSGADEMRRQQEEYQRQAEAERRRRRDTQLGILSQMQAPQLSPQASKRIAALEAESAPRALAEDPLYTGQRAQLLGAGQQLQSGIESEQLGRGVRGGFRNIGSVQDVQDRLGVQLAGLASQAQATRERKRDLAAQASQAYQDAQTQFQNAQANARMAIEAGDSDLALSMINQAMQARQAAANAERQMYGALIGGATTLAGGALAGPMGASAAGGAQQMGQSGGYSLGTNTDFGQPQQFEGFEVRNTGAGISDMNFANARRRGFY